MKILVIDSQFDSAQDLKYWLEQDGHVVVIGVGCAVPQEHFDVAVFEVCDDRGGHIGRTCRDRGIAIITICYDDLNAGSAAWFLGEIAIGFAVKPNHLAEVRRLVQMLRPPT